MAEHSSNLSKMALTWLMGLAVAAAFEIPPARAQVPAESVESTERISPQVLAEIREAPFSEMFSVANGEAFGIKDRDYNPSEPTIGVFSLWADVPKWNRLELVMKYCVENTGIANVSGSLVEVSLLDGDETLVVIDDVVEAGTASINQVEPPRTSSVNTSFYFDPFYDPYYYSPFNFGISYSPTIRLPAVDCSAGVSRFNLMPVSDALAQLPDSTLRMRLLFSDGSTEYWQLGGGTVRALKELPSVE
jgi:hypothetical protein